MNIMKVMDKLILISMNSTLDNLLVIHQF